MKNKDEKASKFTPGPWRALPEERDRDYIRIRGAVLGARYKIANVINPAYEGVHEREAQETRSNARLIAHAPTMYDTLRRALKDMDRIDEVCRLAGVHTFDLMRKDLTAVLRAVDGGKK